MNTVEMSPTLERKRIENIVLLDTWTSTCCGRDKVIPKSFLKYIIQITFSLLAMVFSIYMITTSNVGEREVWISTFSTIIGLHIPNPKLDDD